jgi:hypothetical protein
VRDDLLIARLRRHAVLSCAVMTAAALLLTRGDWWTAAAVVGGGVLSAVSFLSIASGIGQLSAFVPGSRERTASPNVPLALLKIVGRYVLLAFLAYVMIARLRLPPLGLMAGASSFVAAAAVEAGRFHLRKGAGRFFWKKT